MPDKDVRKKILVIGLPALLVLIVLIFYFVKKDSFLEEGLQNMVEKKSDGLYTIQYDTITVDELGGDLYIKDLYITGDTTRLLKMIEEGDSSAVNYLFNVHVPLLKVVDFKTDKALLSKKLECKKILLSKPEIIVYLFPQKDNHPKKKKVSKEIYEQILGDFNLIKADSVLIDSTLVNVTDFETKDVKFKTVNTTINLIDIAIDSTSYNDSSRTFFSKEIFVKAQKAFLGGDNNQAEISQLSFDTKSKTFHLGSFSYDAFKNNGIFKTDISGIDINGISLNGPFKNMDLVMESVDIKEAVFETRNSGKKGQEKSKDKTILNGWISSVILNSFKVNDLSYTNRPKGNEQKELEINNSSFKVENIKLDRSSRLDESLIKSADEIVVMNNAISIESRDEMYRYQFEGLYLNTRTRGIKLDAIKIIPTLSESSFAKAAGVQKDRYNVQFRNVRFHDVEMEKLVKGEVFIDKITTSGNSVKIYHDMSYPADSSKKSGRTDTYPHQKMMSLDMPLNIKTFTLANTYIEYKEKNPKSKSSGQVIFSNTTATISNITSLPPKKGEVTKMTFNSTFLKKVPVTGSFTFYLDEYKRGKFRVEASIEKSFDATTLNPLTRPLALANIDKGTIKSFSFSMDADTSQSRGNIKIGYNNLNISLLKKEGKSYDKKGLMSFLANLVVKDKNDPGPKMKKAEITVKPDKYRSYFNYIWRTIFTGLKETLMVI